MMPASARVINRADWVPQVPPWLSTRTVAIAMLGRAWRHWTPPRKQNTREWADENLYLSPDAGSARPGKYRSDVTPWLWAIQEAIDDPAVQEIVCMKSSQIGWTMGVVMAYIGKRIDLDPCPIVVMFPTADAAREFNQEKFMTTVSVTPRMRTRVDLRSRKDGNRATFKRFAGGFLKFVGSNSPRSVKSSSAPVLIVEEPDDASQDVKGQGDSIRLLKDRAKTYPRFKVVIGGTPTINDLSNTQEAYRNSDQRKLFVPCHHCGEDHVLDWENVRWTEDPNQRHEIYGHAQPETARYACPHCGTLWNDYEKNQNVLRACTEGRWRATAAFNGAAGFGYLGEMYVSWPNSGIVYLVRRFLVAKRKADNGDDREMVAFYNSTLGLPYEYGGKALDVEGIRKQCTLDQFYAEGTVPRGGLAVTIGVDVQHDRFAIIVRAWGRGEESWLVKFHEIYGSVNDSSDLVWQELEQSVFRSFQHDCGRDLYAVAVSVDSSDGNTSDAVYTWVRAMKRKYRRVHLMAIKGDSYRNTDKEIFTLPKQSVDHKTTTKAWKYGLRPFIVGTNKAKDLLLGGEQQRGRIHLAGIGSGRFHVYPSVREDYFDQLTAEVKAPSRKMRGKLVWQKRAGRNNEALDGEVYALHAARAIKTHVLTPAQWDSIEQRIVQSDLFHPSADLPAAEDLAVSSPDAEKKPKAEVTTPTSPASTAGKSSPRRQISKGFVNR